jgi:hypothetical protein
VFKNFPKEKVTTSVKKKTLFPKTLGSSVGSGVFKVRGLPKEDLAKFDYRTESKEEMFGNVPII